MPAAGSFKSGGIYWEKWDDAKGPRPDGYPTPSKRSRTATPPPKNSTQEEDLASHSLTSASAAPPPGTSIGPSAAMRSTVSPLAGVEGKAVAALAKALQAAAAVPKPPKPASVRRRRKSCWQLWCCRCSLKKLCKSWLMPIAVLALAIVFVLDPSGIFSSVGRTLHAMAEVSEGAAAAAAHAVESGTNITVAVAAVVVQAAQGSLSLADDFMMGVDLVDTTGERAAIRVVSPDVDRLLHWIEFDGGGLITPVVQLHFLAALQNTTFWFPVVDTVFENFNLSGSYVHWTLSARRLPSGY